jgi:hypothetical protein
MLAKIWKQQKGYNEKIFRLEHSTDKHHWSNQYLLGITAQIAEVLHEIKWKKHRDEDRKRIVPLNILEEVADIMKYSISLAQVWGFSEVDVLDAMYEKGEMLDFKFEMEFNKTTLKGRDILITDVDGTLANMKQSFDRWLESNGKTEITTYPEYYTLKEAFEETGQYRTMIPYADTYSALQRMSNDGWYIIVVTARPVSIYKRIFKDTFYWLELNHLPFDELHMLDADRLLLASELSKDNNVVLWEDDPDILLRASNLGIKVFARGNERNKHTTLPNVQIVDSYYNVAKEITG